MSAQTVHIIRRTYTEEFHFDPGVIREHWAEMLDAWEGTFEDFVLGLFEDHDGSVFGGRFFYGLGNDDSGIEIIERGIDE